MKLGMNDMRARIYRVTEQIWSICINQANYANYVKWAHKTHISAKRLQLLHFFCPLLVLSIVDNSTHSVLLFYFSHSILTTFSTCCYAFSCRPLLELTFCQRLCIQTTERYVCFSLPVYINHSILCIFVVMDDSRIRNRKSRFFLEI